MLSKYVIYLANYLGTFFQNPHLKNYWELNIVKYSVRIWDVYLNVQAIKIEKLISTKILNFNTARLIYYDPI